MAKISGPIELRPIELRIELPKETKLSEKHVQEALKKAAQDPTFVKRVTDYFATSQTESAVATIVQEGI